MPEKVNVIISAEETADLQELAEGLQRAGLEGSHVMEEIGAVSGSIRREAISTLRSVPGVTGVEEAREFHIAPPKSDVQ